MVVKKAEFVKSSGSLKDCPASILPEFAFIGRSNVGKSSLINMLAGKKGMAKTSARPGKTQTINHFKINDKWMMVDLPGYGYAGVSKTLRAGWSKMIEEYLKKREKLACLFVLIDSRLSPQAIDLDFLRWVGKHGIPFVIVLTKTDKPKRNELTKNINQLENTLLKDWEELPEVFLTSAESKKGKAELLAFIENVISSI